MNGDSCGILLYYILLKKKLRLLLPVSIGSKLKGSRLIEATSKLPKAAHIRRRVKMAVGKTVEAALKMQVPDKNGDMVRYKKADFKYDVKAGFVRF